MCLSYVHAGQPIDTAMTGPAPGPWDISAEPRTLFNSESRHVEVPHTASIKVEADANNFININLYKNLIYNKYL